MPNEMTVCEWRRKNSHSVLSIKCMNRNWQIKKFKRNCHKIQWIAHFEVAANVKENKNTTIKLKRRRKKSECEGWITTNDSIILVNCCIFISFFSFFLRKSCKCWTNANKASQSRGNPKNNKKSISSRDLLN